MNFLKRILWVILIAVIYFTIWKEIRSALTSFVIIPQIETAAEQCEFPIQYEVASNTAVVVYRNADAFDAEVYRFNAPAGFYLLFGLIFLILFKSELKLYSILFGYHLIFATTVVSTFYLGLCYLPGFLHLSSMGNSYFTPFFTFFVLIYLINPSLKTVFYHKEMQEK